MELIDRFTRILEYPRILVFRVLVVEFHRFY
jgi:hypothetical protein